jgi:hypothetical protein
MKKILWCLLLLLTPYIVRATDCSQLVLTLYSDQGFDMRVLVDGTAAKYFRARLYSGHKLLHTFVSDQHGEFRSGSLPEGTYVLLLSSKQKLDVKVVPERSGLHGPFVVWSLFRKSTIESNQGKGVSGQPCPRLGVQG